MFNTHLFKSDKEDWATPNWLFDELDSEFHFTLDACATAQNAKCVKYYTKEIDGLKQDWAGEIVFCNPPYGKELSKWVEKCYNESVNAVVVMLIPVRTDTKWFHKFVYHNCEIRFLSRRLKFIGSNNMAPFPSMIAIFRQGQ